jgi:hypothetical protein
MKRLAVLLALSLVLPALPAMAEGGAQLPPVDNAATLKECGACHMAFPPQMLPARSWQTLMGDLKSHFGEDASLADPLRADITAYLVGHAADAKGTKNGKRYLRGLAADATPLRITETPFWKRGHEEVSASQFAKPAVKSRANCVACHVNAARGDFSEPE